MAEHHDDAVGGNLATGALLHDLHEQLHMRVFIQSHTHPDSASFCGQTTVSRLFCVVWLQDRFAEALRPNLNKSTLPALAATSGHAPDPTTRKQPAKPLSLTPATTLPPSSRHYPRRPRHTHRPLRPRQVAFPRADAGRHGGCGRAGCRSSGCFFAHVHFALGSHGEDVFYAPKMSKYIPLPPYS